MLVPGTEIADQIQAPKVIGHLELHSEERHVRYIAIGGSIVGIAIVAALVYALFFHNAWERDNAARLLSLKTDADALVQAKKYEKAKAKYHELFSLLGDRVVTDESLKAEMESARRASVENNTKVEAVLAARQEAERTKQAAQADYATRAYQRSFEDDINHNRTDYSALTDDEFIMRASRETGFAPADIRDSMAAAYQTSAKPKDRYEAMILALGSLEYDRKQKAGEIASTPASTALDELDARSAALQRRMDTLLAKAKREGMTAEVEAEVRAIREEAEAIRRGYEKYRR